MKFGSAGAGSGTHLGCVLLNYMIGVNITHRAVSRHRSRDAGSRSAVASITSARSSPPSVAARRRHDQGHRAARQQAPQGSAGSADRRKSRGTGDLIASDTWNAIFLPKGAPDAIVKKLNSADAGGHAFLIGDRQARGARRAEIAADNQATLEFFAKLVKDETEKWAKPIKASGVDGGVISRACELTKPREVTSCLRAASGRRDQ